MKREYIALLLLRMLTKQHYRNKSEKAYLVEQDYITEKNFVTKKGKNLCFNYYTESTLKDLG